MSYNPNNPNGQATSANSAPVVLSSAQETILTNIKTAVEIIDNFISGTKGLVTEDNSAAIKTAVETIDNFISGSRGLVTEDNSAAIKTAVELIDNAVSGAGFNITQVGGTNIDTNSGNKSAGTQRVVIATDQPNLTTALNVAPVAGTNRIGSVRLVDSADADLTTTKGTQTSRALGTQDLKDSGRTHINFYAIAAAAGTTTTETAITLTKSSGTAATSTGTSFVITNGKRFRIMAFSVATRGNNTATAQTTTFNLRMNTGGAVVTTSTPILLSVRSATPATANAWDRVIIPIPDGFEILGDGTLQIGITAAATYTTNAPTWDVTIIGYEY